MKKRAGKRNFLENVEGGEEEKNQVGLRHIFLVGALGRDPDFRQKTENKILLLGSIGGGKKKKITQGVPQENGELNVDWVKRGGKKKRI